MNALITAALQHGDILPITHFPLVLLADNEQEYVRWITGYVQKYDNPPTLDRFCREFKNFIPLHENDPLGDIAVQAINERRDSYAVQAANKILLAESVHERAQLFNDAAHVLNNTAGSFMTLSDFDREVYFRQKKRLPFPFTLLEKATGGIARSDLAYIVGRLGSYKTTTALSMATSWFLDGQKVLLQSNEMPYVDCFLKIDSMIAGFNPLDVRRSEKREEITHKIGNVHRMIHETGGEIIIPTVRLTTPAMIASQAAALNVDVICIDGVYLMQPDSKNIGSRWERLASISNDLKQVAMNLAVPVLGVTQLNREAAGEQIIQTEHIAGTDAFAQDADLVMATNPLPKKGKFQLQLIKNRYGPNVTSVCEIDFDTMKLADVTADGWES